MAHERHGAKQPDRFDPTRAGVLDDTARFAYVAPDRVVELLDVRDGAKVCDFGTGTGTYAIEIARRRPSARILALDEQPAMLEKLRAKPDVATLSNVTAIGPDALVEFAGKIDRIFALNVLHELGDDALVSFATLLTPGGFALVIDWNADVERPVGPPNDHVYGVTSARERLESLGYAVETLAGFPYHHAFRVTSVS